MKKQNDKNKLKATDDFERSPQPTLVEPELHKTNDGNGRKIEMVWVPILPEELNPHDE